MSLDVSVLEEELKSIEAERLTADERLRFFSQRGRGRGRIVGPFAGRHACDRHNQQAVQTGTADEAAETGSRRFAGGWGTRRAGRGDSGPSQRSGLGSHDLKEAPGSSIGQPAGVGFSRYEATEGDLAHEEPLPGSNTGRLASAIVMDASQQVNEPGTSKRPLENGATPAVKQRNKRLFGSLLGTLQRFQEEDQRFKRSKLAQSRAEAEQRAEQRAVDETQKLREQQRQDVAKARLEEINRKRELDIRLQAKRHEILVAQKLERESRLGVWLKSAAQPSLLWLPKFHNEDTQLLLEQRQADLEAWKTMQLTKLVGEKAEIEARYHPLAPRLGSFRPSEQETTTQGTFAGRGKEGAEPLQVDLGDTQQEVRPLERYTDVNATLIEDGLDAVDDALGKDVEGVKDLL